MTGRRGDPVTGEGVGLGGVRVDLAELKRLAGEADGEYGIYPETWWGEAANHWALGSPPTLLPDRDITFIAACRPDVVLVLVERLERCEALAAEWRAAAEVPRPWKGEAESDQDQGVRIGVWHSVRKAADELTAALDQEASA